MIHLIFRKKETEELQKSTQVVRPLVIGRDPKADIYLTDDAKISRLHTLVVPRPDGRLDIRDLCSASGTFVERFGEKKRLVPELGYKGAEKGRVILADGEKFFIGKYTIELHYEELLGEPTLHPAALEEDKEITAVTGLDDEDD